MIKKSFYKIASFLTDRFWIIPGLMVCIGILAAIFLIEVDRSDWLPKSLLASAWLYNGGGTGARTLLGAVASSTIGVAGTVFSITIAALSLAAGQMGPRLLRNFTHDRGNQITLGAFLGTFSYSLIVLRSVRTQEEGTFVPHLALSVAIFLALACVGMLVYFVGHMASRINVDTVVGLVSDDVRSAMTRLTAKDESSAAPPESYWHDASKVIDKRRGYLQHVDQGALAAWADDNRLSIKLLVRPGDFVFPGAPIAVFKTRAGAEVGLTSDTSPPDESDVSAAIRNATSLGGERTSSEDLEYAIRQLVEVGVRALSPGINDPHTAISVIDRLASSLCDIAELSLPNGVWTKGDQVSLVVPSVDYAGLTDAMFHMLRQNGSGSVAVLIRMMDVIEKIASVEKRPERRRSLQRHAELVLADGQRNIANESDLNDLNRAYARFQSVIASR